MKKLLVCLMVMIIPTFLSACNNTPVRYIEKDGGYYLQYSNLSKSDSGQATDVRLPVSVKFESAEEMYNDIRNCTFTAEELEIIPQLYDAYDTNDYWPLWDMTKPCIPYHPTAITDYTYQWYGETFSIIYTIENTEYLWNRYDTKESLDNRYSMQGNDSSPFVDVRTLTDDNATYRIRRIYKTKDFNSALPAEIELFVERGDQLFLITIMGLTENVTDEWLMQFELRPYTEN